MIMNSSSLINIDSIHSPRDPHPDIESDSFWTDTSICCTNSVIQYTRSINFLFFSVFFLAPNRPQQKSTDQVFFFILFEVKSSYLSGISVSF